MAAFSEPHVIRHKKIVNMRLLKGSPFSKKPKEMTHHIVQRQIYNCLLPKTDCTARKNTDPGRIFVSGTSEFTKKTYRLYDALYDVSAEATLVGRGSISPPEASATRRGHVWAFRWQFVAQMHRSGPLAIYVGLYEKTLREFFWQAGN